MFGTGAGAKQSPSNVRTRVLSRALRAADERLEEVGEAPLPALTPHGLRRSFASLLYAIGESPPVVMQEMGHTDPALALSIYAQAMRRDEGENERLPALVNGDEWGQEGDSGPGSTPAHGPEPESEDTETRSGSGLRVTRPAGFEPATSASGGQRSIH